MPEYSKLQVLRCIKEIWLLCLITCFGRASAGPGDSVLIARFLDRLCAQQVRQDSFYYAGMFPTLRAWEGDPGGRKPDNSIFYTGLIVFTLQELRPLLRGEERVRCDSIVARALRVYPHYRNAEGRPTYNFWPTDHPVFFPNSFLLDHFKNKQITDDLDDTSILWLGEGIPDSTARKLKALMGAHAAGPGRRARNSYRAVQDLPAYSAWFGVRTPIEFDAGVFCNVLYFIRAAGLETDVHDSASVRFLAYVLQKRKYWKDPAFASSYYPRTPVLIYHLARLMGRFSVDGLDAFRPPLRADARAALGASGDRMDEVILGTSLIRLGDTTALPEVPHDLWPEDVEEDPFVFYIANISSLFPNPVRRSVLHSPTFIYHFYCPAYNDALLLEYLVLRRSLGSGL